MRIEDVIRAREEAEKAVASMPDGPLKTKAFEVVLGRLLDEVGAGPSTIKASTDERISRGTRVRSHVATGSVSQRILLLREEGFFKELRSIGEIRDALRAHGWHYPLSTLSGRLVELVQRGLLRRLLVKVGTRKVWKYSNP